MKLVVLDRDGVINQDSPQYIKTPEEWKPIPNALAAIARLNQAGFRVVVATNQSAIGRGLLDTPTFNAINDKMVKALAQFGGRLDALFYCPHAPEAACACRKPNTGMFMDIMRRFNTHFDGVPCVGDALRDLQAAQAVGGQPVLVLTGKGKATLQEGGLPQDTLIFSDLAEAVASITE